MTLTTYKVDGDALSTAIGPHQTIMANLTTRKEAHHLPRTVLQRLRRDKLDLDTIWAQVEATGFLESRDQMCAMLEYLYRTAAHGLCRSDISWTQYGWACIVGCTECSAGCLYCYAKELHNRRHEIYVRNGGLWKPGGRSMPRQYAKPFGVVQLLYERLGMPLRTRNRGRVFVNASSDVFHPMVPLNYIQTMFLAMGASPNLTFQVLTKRPERMVLEAAKLPWFPNIHMGVTVESAAHAYRKELLLQVPAAVKWISAEPLLGSLGDLDFAGIDWVVVGGESGHSKQRIRPAHPDWYRELRDKCLREGNAFFFKQVGHWVHESQLADTGLTAKTRRRPVHIWPDGSCSYRFGRVVKHDILDGREHKVYPAATA